MKLLIIDDDSIFCETLLEHLQIEGFQAKAVATGEEGIAEFKKNMHEIVLLDQELPDIEGVEVCRRIVSLNREVKIIFVTAYPTYRYAVEAIRAGAYDYLSKPFELEELYLSIKNATNNYRLEQVRDIYNYKSKVEGQQSDIVGKSRSIAEIKEQVKIAAATDVIVLITGETGVGKNVVARAIHCLREKNRPLLQVNCAAIPEQLIESELFGHEKGAFTGATTAKKGVFELAKEGTLILDEIGEMPFLLQSKLLSILEEKKLRRVGGTVQISINPNVIAITNVDIEKAIEHKQFRKDLYYRLSTFRIHVPTLRSRKEDIEDLCNLFISDFSKESITIPAEQMEMLKQYQWPGNTRELKNIIERAILLHKGGPFKPSSFIHQSEISPVQTDIVDKENILTLDEVEKRAVFQAMKLYNGRKMRAARALGISLNRLKRKLVKYGK